MCDTSALEALLTQFLAFDLSTFEIIVGGSLVAYALGHGTGVIIALMRRT